MVSCQRKLFAEVEGEARRFVSLVRCLNSEVYGVFLVVEKLAEDCLKIVLALVIYLDLQPEYELTALVDADPNVPDVASGVVVCVLKVEERAEDRLCRSFK